MLEKAHEYLNRLKILKSRTESQNDKDYVQLHIDIMEYLVDCAEEVEANTTSEKEEMPVKAEVSG